MKSLQQHISEKLVINKNFKPFNYFSEPNKKGRCIYLAIPTVNSKHKTIGLPAKTYSYKKGINKIKLIYNDYDSDATSNIIKNNDGLYVISDEPNIYNDFFVLFDDGALYFLNILFNDPKQLFDTSCFKDSRLQLRDEKLECVDAETGKHFKKDTIEEMIKDIENSMK